MTHDPTNSDGGFITPVQFGAVGDGVHNDLPAFNSMMAFLPTLGGIVFIPDGTYFMNGDFAIKKQLNMFGSSRSTAILKFAPGYGIIMDRNSDISSSVDSHLSDFSIQYANYPPTWQAAHQYKVGDIITNVNRYGAFTQYLFVCTQAGISGNSEPHWPTRDQEPVNVGPFSNVPPVHDGTCVWQNKNAPAILMMQRTFIQRVNILGAACDGIYAFGNVGYGTDVSNCQVINCEIDLQLGRAIYTNGTDSATSKYEVITGQNNYSGGVFDNADTGNTFDSCLMQANGIAFWLAHANFDEFTLGLYATPSRQWMDSHTSLINQNVPLLQIIAHNGQTGAIEPNWTTTIGAQFVDGGITWQVIALTSTGQAYKNRLQSITASLFLNCYTENDQRYSEISYPGIWKGGQGAFTSWSGGWIQLNQTNNNQGYQYQAKSGTSLAATIGSITGESYVLEFGKGAQSSTAYRLWLSADGEWWEMRASGANGPLAFRLTTDTAPEALGHLLLNILRIIGSLDNSDPSVPGTWSAGIVVPGLSQTPTSASGKAGDWLISRSPGSQYPSLWVCTTAAVDGAGAVWSECHFNRDRFVNAPSGSMLVTPYTIPVGFTLAPGTFEVFNETVESDLNANDQFNGNLPDPTLLAIPIGCKYHFWNQAGKGVRVHAQPGQRIRIGSSRTAAGGHVDAASQGCWLTLESLGAGGSDAEWIATAIVGTWTVT